MKRYYTLTELATRFGYTRSAAQGWQKHPDFPEPDALTGVVQGWELDTFRAWALTHRPDILFNKQPTK